ncbi:ATP-binding protein [Pseudomonas sp.]|uniref:sensor histidine kinase n=1 Tax=Pseudomonas sp. TaxID=306 RepID=UPI003D111421
MSTGGNGRRAGAALAIPLLLACLSLCSASVTASGGSLDGREHHRWTVADNGPSQVGALAQTHDGLQFTRYTPPDGKPLGIVSALKAADEGLWAGLRTGGMSLITDTGLVSYPVSAGLPGGVIYGIAKDRGGAVWVAANGGLARFDGTAWQRIGADWNMPGENARAVFVDREGTLWAANEDRLLYLPPDARAFIDADIEVGWVSQMAQAPDGSIWVTERFGDSLRRILPATSGEPVQVNVIDHTNGLLFDGTGAMWIGTSGRGIRQVPPPAPGMQERDHEALMVKGGLSGEETVLRFSIQPVFYRTPLFLVLSGIVVVGILWLLHRFNLRRAAEHLHARLEERHTERERIARELHDTLLQGVQGLMLSFQVVTEQIPSTHPARCKMEKALDRADQVLAEARDRVNDLRDLNEPTQDLVDALSTVTCELQREGNAHFVLSSQGSPRPLHPIVWEESYRIGREALVNAARHAHAHHVEIRIRYTRHAFQLTIADDGKGIDPRFLPPNARPRHWGLCGMQERTRKIGGRLSIQRGAQCGTEIQLTVPAPTAYRHVPRRFTLRLPVWIRR